MSVSMKQIISRAELGDRRRNDRLFDLVQWLTRVVTGGAVAPDKAAAWSVAMAAWRFFNNGSVSLSAAYDVVRAAVRGVLATSTTCFVAHDVSLLDYTKHNTKEDRIPIGDHRGKGYEVYTGLVLSERGQSIGPVFQEVRVEGGCESSEPLVGRERKRGLAKFVGHIEQMEKAVRAVMNCLTGLRVVHIADREFDDLQAVRAWMAMGVEFILRAQHMTRRVLVGDAHVSLEEACGGARLRRAGIVERDGVQYRRWIGEIHVVLDGLSRRGRHRGENPKRGEPVEVRIVVAELRARGKETIRWVLVTNVADAAEWVVQAYVWRWRVERYFYLTKVGFKLETWTQQNGEALARKLATASLTAMVIHRLLAMTDEDPEAVDAIESIALMGGWLGRKRDPIGPIVLLRGVRSLLNAIVAVQEIGTGRLLELGERVLPGFTERKSARKT